MIIAKFTHMGSEPMLGRVEEDRLHPLELSASEYRCLADILNDDDPIAVVEAMTTKAPLELSTARLLPPIDAQEVWAAGVTYRRSQKARMEESAASASCYDLVYDADRPELFFKATPHRVCGHQQPLRIRWDAKWNVPEPEITLVISRSMKIVGLTIGNDMSSRDIEGENPLYLPQAKCYDACAGLGPWIRLYRELPPVHEIGVELKIVRDDQVAFQQETSAAEMARGFLDLVQWLGRDNCFPQGVFLMTGTGIVPDSPFTLLPGDWVHITIDGVGTLSNPIVQNSVPSKVD
jgi:2-dehydro-3-deoxy-D-arabinonate dehydratase